MRRGRLILRRHGLYLGALLAPLAFWLVLKGVPTLDVELSAGSFHVIVMSAVAVCAVVVAIFAAHASTQVRQPGVVVLAAGCLAVGVLLLGHGLTTPFQLGQPLNQWVSRLPYLAMTLFTLTLAVAASSRTRPSMQRLGARPLAVMIPIVLPAVILVTIVVTNPHALAGSRLLTHEAGVRDVLAFGSIALAVPVSWLYWRRFRLSLDIVQASLAIAAVMTAAAFLSMHLGELWRLSWWDYHGCLLAGFAGVVFAIVRRHRANDAAVTALESAFETDPLTLIATNYPTPLRSLVESMEVKDAYTHGHSARTAALSVSIGVRMGLDGDELRVLAQGAYLHDIGKLGIPDEILNKPGRLTPAEREIINTHPTIGCDIASAHHVLEPCLPIIRYHHERYDGQGYPHGLAGSDIPLLARIAAVADVWDALISDRAYRPGWTPQRALDHIVDGAGEHLDPRVVAILLDIAADLGISPSGMSIDPAAVVAATADCQDAGPARNPLVSHLTADL